MRHLIYVELNKLDRPLGTCQCPSTLQLGLHEYIHTTLMSTSFDSLILMRQAHQMSLLRWEPDHRLGAVGDTILVLIYVPVKESLRGSLDQRQSGDGRTNAERGPR